MRYLVILLIFLSLGAHSNRVPKPIVRSAIAGGGGASTLNDNLVAYWNMDETSDGSVQVDRVDSVGSLDLTDQNTTAATTGKIGNAADFEASNTERLVSGADPAVVDFANTDFTIAVWVRHETSAANQYYVSKYNTTGNNRQYALGYGSTADRIRVIISSDGAATGETILVAENLGSPADATWYAVIASYKASTDELRIRVGAAGGALGNVDTTTHADGSFNGTAAFQVGNRPTTDHFDGLLDELYIWSRALTEAEEEEWFTETDGGDPYPW